MTPAKPSVARSTQSGLLRDQDRGATTTEYGLLVCFIAIVIAVGITAFGGALNNWFSNLAAVLPVG